MPLRVEAELATLGTASNVIAIDTSRIKADLLDRLADWQGLPKRETPEARAILREILVGRLIFQPKETQVGGITSLPAKQPFRDCWPV